MGKLVEVLKPIEATTETAFQRAILRNGRTILGSHTEIEWLDIELPIEGGRNSRKQCVDLIGRMGNRYVLCELKFGKDSRTDNPNFAAEELKCYHKKIKSNWIELDKSCKHHPDAKPFLWKEVASDSTMLMVVANASYWAYWLGHRNIDIFGIEGIVFCSVDIPADSFVKQKGDADVYTPIIKTECWDII